MNPLTPALHHSLGPGLGSGEHAGQGDGDEDGPQVASYCVIAPRCQARFRRRIE